LEAAAFPFPLHTIHATKLANNSGVVQQASRFAGFHILSHQIHNSREQAWLTIHMRTFALFRGGHAMRIGGRRRERNRLLLTLELVVLPAAALILLSVLHLRSIQRDRAVEAAIQRDFQRVLKMADKRMAARTYDLVDPIRESLATTGEPCAETLDTILAERPYAASVFVFDRAKGLLFRAQSRSNDPEFRQDSEKLASTMQGWFSMEGEDMLAKIRAKETKGEPPYHFFENIASRGKTHIYQNVALFTLPESSKRTVFGGVALDSNYLKAEFLPQSLAELLKENTSEAHKDSEGTHPVFQIHIAKDNESLATSPDWDGGSPEVERDLAYAFPGLVLGVKYRGTTVEEIGQRFLHTSYMILGGLSLLLTAGIFFMYRNVSREVELAKLKSDFVSNVSHELRTPIALIRLYAETLELGRLPATDKQKQYHRIIREETERLTALINNILDFSRIEAGRKEYKFQETDLSALVRDTLDSYRYQIEQNGFHFELEIYDGIPPVSIDRESIARCLLNLISNSIKYSDQEKYLKVSLRREDQTIKLDVIDHGIGIPRSAQDKIFDKFYRVEDPLVHNTKGSGLGLCLVKSIVGAHGGRAFVESTPGQGSKFTITIPVPNSARAVSDLRAATAS
jgi:signal transduction histidine kinase